MRHARLSKDACGSPRILRAGDVSKGAADMCLIQRQHACPPMPLCQQLARSAWHSAISCGSPEGFGGRTCLTTLAGHIGQGVRTYLTLFQLDKSMTSSLYQSPCPQAPSTSKQTAIRYMMIHAQSHLLIPPVVADEQLTGSPASSNCDPLHQPDPMPHLALPGAGHSTRHGSQVTSKRACTNAHTIIGCSMDPRSNLSELCPGYFQRKPMSSKHTNCKTKSGKMPRLD